MGRWWEGEDRVVARCEGDINDCRGIEGSELIDLRGA